MSPPPRAPASPTPPGTAPLPRSRPQITVDGDTSTNDTVIGLASGAAGAPVITDAASPDGRALEAAVTALLQARGARGLVPCMRGCEGGAERPGQREDDGRLRGRWGAHAAARPR